MDTQKITRSETEHAFRYVYRGPDGMPPAELSGAIEGPHLWSADYTGVPAAYRGQGIARLLVERLVADAQQAGVQIKPRCSYVSAQFAKNPDWAHLLGE
ncbi:MAG: putative GNAT family acetyltransferase [Cognaticolwellia sp.]|jgi:predicted GNAT family acetyltransferase